MNEITPNSQMSKPKERISSLREHNLPNPDPLMMEAVYYSAPIPRNLGILTVMGLVFDKVYFPGVRIPQDGFDEKELQKETERIENLTHQQRQDNDLIGVLRFTRFAKTLNGLCEFTASETDVFGGADRVPAEMVDQIYRSIHGPHRPGWQPTFSTGYNKGLPGSDQFVAYPGTYHYFANALLHASQRNLPLINDLPGLPIPGLQDVVPRDNAKALSALLTIECTKLVLPEVPLLSPDQLMEFRHENRDALRAFRRSMFSYASDFNEKLREVSLAELENKTTFFVHTEILPVLDELRHSFRRGSRPWYKRAVDGIRIIPEIAAGCFVSEPTGAIVRALLRFVPQFLAEEVQSRGDRKGSLTRSGLYYLIRMEALRSNK